jgi:hypothetical protein
MREVVAGWPPCVGMAALFHCAPSAAGRLWERSDLSSLVEDFHQHGYEMAIVASSVLNQK